MALKKKQFSEITNKNKETDGELEAELAKHFSIANIEEGDLKVTEIDRLSALQEKMEAFHRNTMNFYEHKILNYKQKIKQLEEELDRERQKSNKLTLLLKGYNRLKQMYKEERRIN